MDEKPVTAVVIDPIRREEFSAQTGAGATLDNGSIRVSKQQGIVGSMLSFATSSVSSPGYGYEFSKSYKELFNQDLEMRNSGSVAWDLWYLGTGRLDGYWAHGGELWDVAAGLLIARESGALISDFNGDPKYLDGDHFIYATPKCYKAILKSVKPYFEKY